MKTIHLPGAHRFIKPGARMLYGTAAESAYYRILTIDKDDQVQVRKWLWHDWLALAYWNIKRFFKQ